MHLESFIQFFLLLSPEWWSLVHHNKLYFWCPKRAKIINLFWIIVIHLKKGMHKNFYQRKIHWLYHAPFPYKRTLRLENKFFCVRQLFILFLGIFTKFFLNFTVTEIAVTLLNFGHCNLKKISFFYSNFILVVFVEKNCAMALNTTEALMSGFLKSSDIPHHHLAYGAAHSHHSSQLPPGMPMTMPFSLPHGLDGFGQGVWGNYFFYYLSLISLIFIIFIKKKKQNFAFY